MGETGLDEASPMAAAPGALRRDRRRNVSCDGPLRDVGRMEP
jgi:hypothetical protein